MSTSQDSGRIWLADGVVHYESRDYGSWEFPVADLKLYGEYTTDNGPFIDDWFMVFVVAADRDWHEASVYADSSTEFRKQLAAVLHAEELFGDLGASTDFDSRIIWPLHLRGQHLFRFTTVELSFWERLKRFGLGEIRHELSDKARDYVTRAA